MLGEQEGLYVSELGKNCPMEIFETLTVSDTEGRPIWKLVYMHEWPMCLRLPRFVIEEREKQFNSYLDYIALNVSSEKPLRFYEKLGLVEFKRIERSNDVVVLIQCEQIVLEIFVNPKHSKRVEG